MQGNQFAILSQVQERIQLMSKFMVYDAFYGVAGIRMPLSCQTLMQRFFQLIRFGSPFFIQRHTARAFSIP